MLYVTRNDYPDYCRYGFARRLQRHWRRTVLWHRILWRRRPRPHRRHPVDPVTAWTNLGFVARTTRRHHPGKRDPVFHSVNVKIAKSSGILDTPLSRSMTTVIDAPPEIDRTAAP